MAKEINVKMELWKKAHELESKAMENGDSNEMRTARVFKASIESDMFTSDGKAVESDVIHDGYATEGYEPKPQANGNGLGRGLDALMNGGGQ